MVIFYILTNYILYSFELLHYNIILHYMISELYDIQSHLDHTRSQLALAISNQFTCDMKKMMILF